MAGVEHTPQPARRRHRRRRRRRRRCDSPLLGRVSHAPHPADWALSSTPLCEYAATRSHAAAADPGGPGGGGRRGRRGRGQLRRRRRLRRRGARRRRCAGGFVGPLGCTLLPPAHADVRGDASHHTARPPLRTYGRGFLPRAHGSHSPSRRATPATPPALLRARPGWCATHLGASVARRAPRTLGVLAASAATFRAVHDALRPPPSARRARALAQLLAPLPFEAFLCAGRGPGAS